MSRWAQGHFPALPHFLAPAAHPVAVPQAHALLQDLAVGGLGEAEVHELIQKFIHDDKIVSDALLQLLEVL